MLDLKIILYGEEHNSDGLPFAYQKAFENGVANNCVQCFVEKPISYQSRIDELYRLAQSRIVQLPQKRRADENLNLLRQLNMMYPTADYSGRGFILEQFIVVLSLITGIRIVCIDEDASRSYELLLRAEVYKYLEKHNNTASRSELYQLTKQIDIPVPEKELYMQRLLEDLKAGHFRKNSSRLMVQRLDADPIKANEIEIRLYPGPAMGIFGKLHTDLKRKTSISSVLTEKYGPEHVEVMEMVGEDIVRVSPNRPALDLSTIQLNFPEFY